jgi:small subunit ribosomal protein S17
MKGVVTSNKMQKALVVTVYTTKLHPKYKKRYKIRKKYHAACDDSSKYTVGQDIEIVSCRPISKTINFKVVQD